MSAIPRAEVEEAGRRRDAHRANRREWKERGLINRRGEFVYHVHMFNVNVSTAYWVLPWHCPGDLVQPDKELVLAWHHVDKWQGFPIAWHDESALEWIDACTHWVTLQAGTKMAFDSWLARVRDQAMTMAHSRIGQASSIKTHPARHMALLELLRSHRIDKSTGD